MVLFFHPKKTKKYSTKYGQTVSSVLRVGPKMAAAAPPRGSPAFHFIPPGGLATDEEFAAIWEIFEDWPLRPQRGTDLSKLAGVMLLQPPSPLQLSCPSPALEDDPMLVQLPQPATTVLKPTPTVLILYGGTGRLKFVVKRSLRVLFRNTLYAAIACKLIDRGQFIEPALPTLAQYLTGYEQVASVWTAVYNPPSLATFIFLWARDVSLECATQALLQSASGMDALGPPVQEGGGKRRRVLRMAVPLAAGADVPGSSTDPEPAGSLVVGAAPTSAITDPQVAEDRHKQLLEQLFSNLDQGGDPAAMTRELMTRLGGMAVDLAKAQAKVLLLEEEKRKLNSVR